MTKSFVSSIKSVVDKIRRVVERFRRVFTLWRVLLVFIGFVAALKYDEYRNKSTPPRPRPDYASMLPRHDPYLRIRNPLDLKDPASTKLGQIEKQVSATQLFEDFRREEQSARREYLGKTFLIEGAVVEHFELNTWDLGGESAPLKPPDFAEKVTVGVMLLPETLEMLHAAHVESTASLRPTSVSAEFQPYLYEGLYRELLAARDPKFAFDKPHEFIYWQYSDDHSFRSHVGGVYCMFARPHSTTPWVRDEPARKRITAECKIVDYKPGGLETVESYKLVYDKNTKQRTKPRVLAAGCLEVNYEIDK